MTNRLDRVRDIMDQAEDVDLPEGLVPPAEEASPGAGDAGFDGVDPGPPPGPPPEGEDQPPPPEKLCVDLPLNDYGNGRRLIVHHGLDLLYIPRVGWHVWDDRRWRLDPDGIEVRRRAHRLTELIAREIWHMDLPAPEMAVLAEAEAVQAELDELGVIPAKDRTDDQIARLAQIAALRREADRIRDKRDKSIGRRLTHAKNAGNSNAIKNLMTEAAAVIARPLDDLDRPPLDINTLSGVLRFALRPGEDDGGQNAPHPVAGFELLPHAREQLLTKLMPVEYDPGAKCPRFMAFIERVQPLPELRRFIQRWLGYSLTGLTAEQKFAFFYGGGANGKSVLLDLMARMLGDYAASAKIESITGKNRRGGGDATPDLMVLIGARFVRTSEPDEGAILQEGLIKDVTGGEPILVRALNENFVLIYPLFKLTIAGNHRPEIRGGDEGIWRRVLLVPWDVQIPPEERDPDLGAALWEERSGILNWLIAGLVDYLQHGLMVPEAVSAATAEYREDSDPVAAFLTQCCGVSGKPEHSIRSKDLTEAVIFWMEERGGGAWTPRTIQKRIKAKAGKWKSPATGQQFARVKNSDAYYAGLSFIEPFRSQFEAHQQHRMRSDLRRQSDGLL